MVAVRRELRAREQDANRVSFRSPSDEKGHEIPP